MAGLLIIIREKSRDVPEGYQTFYESNLKKFVTSDGKDFNVKRPS
jgi:hypothetical protein